MRSRGCRYLFVILLFCSAWSCKKPLSPTEYVKWVNSKDNGLIVDVEAGEYVYSLQYRPLDLIAIQELGLNDTLTLTEVEEIKKEFGQTEYYILRIESTDRDTEVLRNGISSREDYLTRLQYFTSQVQQDILLVCGEDSSYCSMSHFERNYKMAPYNNLLLAFDVNPVESLDKEKDRTLIFFDRVLGTGTIELTISGSAIKNIPKLKLI